MKITESDSLYSDLENRSISEILHGINAEDKKVAEAISKEMPAIEALAEAYTQTIAAGNKVFYIGAGTSGRLGIVDASELPPTYGLEHGRVIGLIAGGDEAIRKAVEFAEDNVDAAWLDLTKHGIKKGDLVIGIAASGSTPYVVGGLKTAREKGIRTGCISSNPQASILAYSDYPVCVVTGPEFVTGSTRMKSGTAQKLVLNMISTAAMIKNNRVKGNKMVDMTPTNHKLVKRGIEMICDSIPVSRDEAAKLLESQGSVRKAIDYYLQNL